MSDGEKPKDIFQDLDVITGCPSWCTYDPDTKHCNCNQIKLNIDNNTIAIADNISKKDIPNLIESLIKIYNAV